MVYWQEWLKSVLALLVLLGILEMLLPPGELAKFSKLVLGFSLMLAFLQPITILLQQDFVPPDLPVFQTSFLEQEIEERATRVMWAVTKSFWPEGVEQKEEELEHLLSQVKQVEKINVEIVETRGRLEQVLVLLEPLERDLEEQVQHVVSAALNVDFNRIKVAKWPD